MTELLKIFRNLSISGLCEAETNVIFLFMKLATETFRIGMLFKLIMPVEVRPAMYTSCIYLVTLFNCIPYETEAKETRVISF
jgi:hypothetical protein